MSPHDRLRGKSLSNTYKASGVKCAQFDNTGWGGPVLSGSRPPVL